MKWFERTVLIGLAVAASVAVLSCSKDSPMADAADAADVADVADVSDQGDVADAVDPADVVDSTGVDCVTAATCAGLECGSDPVCGTSCGTCDAGYKCNSGLCVPDGCQPDCSGRICGRDPECGESCGVCDGTKVCNSGTCIDSVWTPGEYTVDCTDGMCLVPAGSFWMGCNSAVDDECEPAELPYHELTISAFRIGKTEVTQGEWKALMNNNPSSNASCGDDCPVEDVNWWEALAFCNAMSDRDGLEKCYELTGCTGEPGSSPAMGCTDVVSKGVACAGYRLPTEAEWEKAARGTDGRKFPWGNEDATCDKAVMVAEGTGCATDAPMAVCSKSPAGDSPYGLCDMSGNLQEFVFDWYDWVDYYQNGPSTNPEGPTSGGSRVYRGGSRYYESVRLRASSRDSGLPGMANPSTGLRIVKSVH